MEAAMGQVWAPLTSCHMSRHHVSVSSPLTEPPLSRGEAPSPAPLTSGQLHPPTHARLDTLTAGPAGPWPPLRHRLVWLRMAGEGQLLSLVRGREPGVGPTYSQVGLVLFPLGVRKVAALGGKGTWFGSGNRPGLPLPTVQGRKLMRKAPSTSETASAAGRGGGARSSHHAHGNHRAQCPTPKQNVSGSAQGA